MGNPVIDAVLTRTSSGNSVCVSASSTEGASTYADDAGALRKEVKRCQHLAEDFFTAVCSMVRSDLGKGFVTENGLSAFATWTDRIGGQHIAEDQTSLHPIGVGGQGKIVYDAHIHRGDESDENKDVKDPAMRFFPPDTKPGQVVGELEKTYRKLLEDGHNLPDKGSFRVLSNGISVVPEYVSSWGQWWPFAYMGVMERVYRREGEGIAVTVTHMTMMMDHRYVREGTDEHKRLIDYIAYRMGGDIDGARQFFRIS
jgi:hypothetical protein